MHLSCKNTGLCPPEPELSFTIGALLVCTVGFAWWWDPNHLALDFETEEKKKKGKWSPWIFQDRLVAWGWGMFHGKW